jgi:predicted RNA binding protein with dsRBD fold (UPF0201 family)
MPYKEYAKDVYLEKKALHIKVKQFKRETVGGTIDAVRVSWDEWEDPKVIDHMQPHTDVCSKLNEVIDSVNKLVKKE